MATRVQVDDKHQIVIPPEARRELGIEPGVDLLVAVRDGCLVLIPEPGDFVERLEGLHRAVWLDLDPDEYVRQEREAW